MNWRFCACVLSFIRKPRDLGSWLTSVRFSFEQKHGRSRKRFATLEKVFVWNRSEQWWLKKLLKLRSRRMKRCDKPDWGFRTADGRKNYGNFHKEFCYGSLKEVSRTIWSPKLDSVIYSLSIIDSIKLTAISDRNTWRKLAGVCWSLKRFRWFPHQTAGIFFGSLL